MKKHIIFILLFINYCAFAQDGFFDKTYGLKNILEKNELRIYGSNSSVLFSSQVFVLKQKSNGKWKAKLYRQSGRDNIYIKNLKVNDVEEFWNALKLNKPIKDSNSFKSMYLDPDWYEVYWSKNGKVENYSFEEPLDLRNRDDEMMKRVFQFFQLIENKFKFKFKVD